MQVIAAQEAGSLLQLLRHCNKQTDNQTLRAQVLNTEKHLLNKVHTTSTLDYATLLYAWNNSAMVAYYGTKMVNLHLATTNLNYCYCIT